MLKYIFLSLTFLFTVSCGDNLKKDNQGGKNPSEIAFHFEQVELFEYTNDLEQEVIELAPKRTVVIKVLANENIFFNRNFQNGIKITSNFLKSYSYDIQRNENNYQELILTFKENTYHLENTTFNFAIEITQKALNLDENENPELINNNHSYNFIYKIKNQENENPQEDPVTNPDLPTNPIFKKIFKIFKNSPKDPQIPPNFTPPKKVKDRIKNGSPIEDGEIPHISFNEVLSFNYNKYPKDKITLTPTNTIEAVVKGKAIKFKSPLTYGIDYLIKSNILNPNNITLNQVTDKRIDFILDSQISSTAGEYFIEVAFNQTAFIKEDPNIIVENTSKNYPINYSIQEKENDKNLAFMHFYNIDDLYYLKDKRDGQSEIGAIAPVDNITGYLSSDNIEFKDNLVAGVDYTITSSVFLDSDIKLLVTDYNSQVTISFPKNYASEDLTDNFAIEFHKSAFLSENSKNFIVKGTTKKLEITFLDYEIAYRQANLNFTDVNEFVYTKYLDNIVLTPNKEVVIELDSINSDLKFKELGISDYEFQSDVLESRDFQIKRDPQNHKRLILSFNKTKASAKEFSGTFSIKILQSAIEYEAKSHIELLDNEYVYNFRYQFIEEQYKVIRLDQSLDLFEFDFLDGELWKMPTEDESVSTILDEGYSFISDKLKEAFHYKIISNVYSYDHTDIKVDPTDNKKVIITFPHYMLDIETTDPYFEIYFTKHAFNMPSNNLNHVSQTLQFDFTNKQFKTISGFVFDQNYIATKGVEIELENTNSNLTTTFVSDIDGAYNFIVEDKETIYNINKIVYNNLELNDYAKNLSLPKGLTNNRLKNITVFNRYVLNLGHSSGADGTGSRRMNLISKGYNETGAYYAWGDNWGRNIEDKRGNGENDRPHEDGTGRIAVPGDQATFKVASNKLYARGNNGWYKTGRGTNHKDTDWFMEVTLLDGGSINPFAVDMSGSSGALLNQTGALYSWGTNECHKGNRDGGDFGITRPEQTSRELGLTFVQVAKGKNYTLLLDNIGDVYFYGKNDTGVLADGTHDGSCNLMTKIEELKDVIYISSGSGHAGALDKRGDMYLWGYNDMFQVKNSGINEITKPYLDKENIRFMSLAGNTTLYRIHEIDQITAQGENDEGQAGCNWAGDGNSWIKECRVAGSVDKDIIETAGSNKSSYFLTRSGDLYSVGGNPEGELGIGSRTSHKLMQHVGNYTAFPSISSNYEPAFNINWKKQ